MRNAARIHWGDPRVSVGRAVLCTPLRISSDVAHGVTRPTKRGNWRLLSSCAFFCAVT
jgi:hypothetical protein